jgi:hypothetical protein
MVSRRSQQQRKREAALRGKAIVRGAITPGICASRSVTLARPLASTASGSLITGLPERATISRATRNGTSERSTSPMPLKTTWCGGSSSHGW